MTHRQRIESGFTLSVEERLALLTIIISDALTDREGHLRMDDDGAPPVGEVPHDPYLELVRESVRLSMRTSCECGLNIGARRDG